MDVRTPPNAGPFATTGRNGLEPGWADLPFRRQREVEQIGDDVLPEPRTVAQAGMAPTCVAEQPASFEQTRTGLRPGVGGDPVEVVSDHQDWGGRVGAPGPREAVGAAGTIPCVMQPAGHDPRIA
jgi:hypothetical protein